MQNIDLELLDRVKRLAILAMISDDDLMELLIFKGGSAIIDPNSIENIELIRNIFEIKKVPFSFIKRIKEQREYHQENFESSLKTTVSNTENLKDFNYYFDYVLAKFESIVL